MANIEYLEWTSHAYERCEASLEAANSRLASCQNSLERLVASLENYRLAFSIFKDLYENNSWEDSFSAFFKSAYLTSTESNIRRNLETTQSIEETISYEVASIARIEESLNQLKTSGGFKKLHLPSTRSLFKNFPNVDPRSVQIRTISTGPYIQFVMKGLKMTPTENPYTWLVPYDSLPVIPLQPILIKVHLRLNRITFSARVKEKHLCCYTYAYPNTPHPHILSHNSACLGDFNGPIAEAIDSLDFNTLLTCVKLFLERAIHSDAAGRSWVSYFKGLDIYRNMDYQYYNIARSEQGTHIKFEEREQRGFYDYVIYDENNNVVSKQPYRYNEIYNSEVL